MKKLHHMGYGFEGYKKAQKAIIDPPLKDPWGEFDRFVRITKRPTKEDERWVITEEMKETA